MNSALKVHERSLPGGNAIMFVGKLHFDLVSRSRDKAQELEKSNMAGNPWDLR